MRRMILLTEKMAKSLSAKRRRQRLFPRKRSCNVWATRQWERCVWRKMLNEQEMLGACFVPWSTEKQPQDWLNRQMCGGSDRV